MVTFKDMMHSSLFLTVLRLQIHYSALHRNVRTMAVMDSGLITISTHKRSNTGHSALHGRRYIVPRQSEIGTEVLQFATNQAQTQVR
jgi:hypothetical protein